MLHWWCRQQATGNGREKKLFAACPLISGLCHLIMSCLSLMLLLHLLFVPFCGSSWTITLADLLTCVYLFLKKSTTMLWKVSGTLDFERLTPHSWLNYFIAALCSLSIALTSLILRDCCHCYHYLAVSRCYIPPSTSGWCCRTRIAKWHNKTLHFWNDKKKYLTFNKVLIVPLVVCWYSQLIFFLNYVVYNACRSLSHFNDNFAMFCESYNDNDGWL